jgi:hypothetical protein
MKTDKLIKHLFEGLKQKGVNEISAIRKISEKFDIEAADVMNIVEGKSFRKDDKYGDEEKKKETFGERNKRKKEKKTDQDKLNEDFDDNDPNYLAQDEYVDDEGGYEQGYKDGYFEAIEEVKELLGNL